MYGLNVGQFRTKLLDPTLEYLGLYSPAASNLLLGTALQESRLEFILQIRGPAIGLFQMEPATFYDIYLNYLAYQPKLKTLVDDLAIGTPDPAEMAGNIFFAIGMARVHYRRVSAPLPDANDALALASYWKKYYNTPLGRGTVEEALPHFREACKYGDSTIKRA
jgi:hypothetical protein